MSDRRWPTRIAAMAILFLGFTLVMGGFGTLFAGITGEKQHRVTEQMIAIVRPQVWMDGKIIGLAAAALVGTTVTTLGILLVFRILPRLLGRAAIALPPIASDYGTLAFVVDKVSRRQEAPTKAVVQLPDIARLI